MPTLTWNRRLWAAEYDWNRGGEEWSGRWGNSEAQWFHVIYPRIHRAVPARIILEIGVGYGRFTQYLLPLCENLLGVDLAEKCVEACRQRFRKNAKFYLNDGKTLNMVRDSSVDFVFSIDSLVHADPDTLRSYVHEFSRILKAGGRGFIHHSNLGAYRDMMGENPHNRDVDMTAELFRKFCVEVSLNCVGQELINWGSYDLIDCFSSIAKNNDEPYVRVENPDFMTEANHVRLTQAIYERQRHAVDPVHP
jgi:SAM-dependent methyltransferase